MKTYKEEEAKKLKGRIELHRDRVYPRSSALRIASRMNDSGQPILIEQITRSEKTGRKVRRYLAAQITERKEQS